SFVMPGRSARTTSSPSRSNISTCGAHVAAVNSPPSAGGIQLRPRPKSPNNRSISSPKRLMKENGLRPYGENVSSPRRSSACESLRCWVFVSLLFFAIAPYLLGSTTKSHARQQLWYLRTPTIDCDGPP